MTRATTSRQLVINTGLEREVQAPLLFASNARCLSRGSWTVPGPTSSLQGWSWLGTWHWTAGCPPVLGAASTARDQGLPRPTATPRRVCRLHNFPRRTQSVPTESLPSLKPTLTETNSHQITTGFCVALTLPQKHCDPVSLFT